MKSLRNREAKNVIEILKLREWCERVSRV